MRKIRNYVFETNSSSTHSIAVPNFTPINIPKKIIFRVGSYGWEFKKVKPYNYIYTLSYLFGLYDNSLSMYLNKIKKVLKDHKIHYVFIKPKIYTSEAGYRYLDDGGVDHYDQAAKFFNTVIDDEDLLYKFLIGGLVFTGTDNTRSDDEELKNERYNSCVEIYHWNKDGTTSATHVENKYYKPEYNNYTWFKKLN